MGISQQLRVVDWKRKEQSWKEGKRCLRVYCARASDSSPSRKSQSVVKVDFLFFSSYRVTILVRGNLLLTKIWDIHHPVWAVGSYSSFQQLYVLSDIRFSPSKIVTLCTHREKDPKGIHDVVPGVPGFVSY